VGLQGWVGRLAGEATHLGSAGAVLVLRVSADAGSTWAAADGGSVDTGGPTLPLDAAGLQVGASVALSPRSAGR
jgi:hypothetical protein